jgi:serine/threonine-protein kinase
VPADGGIRFGQYLLLRRIARGGMAEVFLAQQRGLEGFDRRVAVKRILPHLFDSPDFVRMFLGEAKLAAQLTHPNIVHIYDFGKVESDYFLAMEFVDGVHAGQIFKLAEGRGDAGRPPDKMPPVLVARIGADAASALHYAHEMRGPNSKPLGLVHRDVSPANIMVSYDGVVKLCDFGIAKAAALSDQLTNPGQVKGKYAYMSPEQTVAAPLDGRSDVFSLAIVLWELVTGRFIVARGDAVDAMRAIRDGKLESLSKVAPGCPPALAKAISWALESRREKRATAAQLAEALEGYIKSSPDLGTSMQLAAWIRARFHRDGTGQLPAILPPGIIASPGGTPRTQVSPGTVVAPGTGIASATQGPVTPPAAIVPNKLAGRVLEDRVSPFASDLDEEVAATLKRPEPTVTLTRDEAMATLIDDPTNRASEESTLRDKRTSSLADTASTVTHSARAASTGEAAPSPGVAAVMPTVIAPPPVTNDVSARVTGSGARPAATPSDSNRRRMPLAPSDHTKQRRTRVLLAVVGLIGLGLISFAIALAASSMTQVHATADGAVIVVSPRDAPDVVVKAPPPVDAEAPIPPPPVDAGPKEAYLVISTKPAGATIKVGDQTRMSPAQLILAAGPIKITAELSGYADEHRTVELEPGEHHEIEIAFTTKLHHANPVSVPVPVPEMGKLTVRTTPYSDVYEDGNLLASTPFAERPMLAGQHVLVFKNPKHATIEKKVTIMAGKTLKLNFPLP